MFQQALKRRDSRMNAKHLAPSGLDISPIRTQGYGRFASSALGCTVPRFQRCEERAILLTVRAFSASNRATFSSQLI
jgi:hypothetical protein